MKKRIGLVMVAIVLALSVQLLTVFGLPYLPLRDTFFDYPPPELSPTPTAMTSLTPTAMTSPTPTAMTSPTPTAMTSPTPTAMTSPTPTAMTSPTPTAISDNTVKVYLPLVRK